MTLYAGFSAHNSYCLLILAITERTEEKTEWSPEFQCQSSATAIFPQEEMSQP